MVTSFQVLNDVRPNETAALATIATTTACRPLKDETTVGRSRPRSYRAESVRMSAKAGKPKPTKLARAPATPPTRRPTYAAVCIAVAPGIIWQSATPSAKDGPFSHRFRSTAIRRMYATIDGPPKAVALNRKNARKSSAGRGP
jgi:hypothetical protein